jgi:hypothetical protein
MDFISLNWNRNWYIFKSWCTQSVKRVRERERERERERNEEGEREKREGAGFR